jgi:hypothetical protein
MSFDDLNQKLADANKVLAEAAILTRSTSAAWESAQVQLGIKDAPIAQKLAPKMAAQLARVKEIIAKQAKADPKLAPTPIVYKFEDLPALGRAHSSARAAQKAAQKSRDDAFKARADAEKVAGAT